MRPGDYNSSFALRAVELKTVELSLQTRFQSFLSPKKEPALGKMLNNKRNAMWSECGAK